MYFDVSDVTRGSIGTVPRKGTSKRSANDFPPLDENKFVQSCKKLYKYNCYYYYYCYVYNNKCL